VVVAVAVKFTGEPTELPFPGEVTCTPDCPPEVTVTVMGVVDDPPQLSHSVITVSYFAGDKFRLVFSEEPFTT
jgi:hypothetical protein